MHTICKSFFKPLLTFSSTNGFIFVAKNSTKVEIFYHSIAGYPGDAVTKKFLRDNLDPVFGFPSIVRFSWKTAETLIEDKCVKMEFEEVDPEEVDFDHFKMKRNSS